MHAARSFVGCLVAALLALAESAPRAAVAGSDCSLVCALIVKDEEESLATTLLSTQCDTVFLLDTGSKDGTIEVARRFAAAHGVTLQLRESSFVDFSTSRNELLRWVRRKAASDAWVMLLDANDELCVGAASFGACMARRPGGPAALMHMAYWRRARLCAGTWTACCAGRSLYASGWPA